MGNGFYRNEQDYLFYQETIAGSEERVKKNIWDEMFMAAKMVQNGRKISDYVEAGGVAAAVLSAAGKYIREYVSTPAAPLGFAQKEMPFLI